MLASLTLALALSQAGGAEVETLFQQVAPPAVNGKLARKHDHAVVLIHGYHVHFLDRSVPRATFRSWQKADSPLVRALARQADVFVFAYGQDASIDAIACKSKLPAEIAALRKRGYQEITLAGHSAGGLIARHLVEDLPDVGVTRVVQICAPNGGSSLARLTVPRSQRVFVDCLTHDGRKTCLLQRAGKHIPDKIQFVCVVGKGNGSGSDGVVSCVHQWTEDLQKQGIPAVGIEAGHLEIVRAEDLARRLAQVIHAEHGRWTAEQLAKGKKVILGK